MVIALTTTSCYDLSLHLNPTPLFVRTYVFRNEDRAGAVLQVLQELEAAEVNVGRLNVGRQEVTNDTVDVALVHTRFLREMHPIQQYWG